MQKNDHDGYLTRLFGIVENDFDQALTELEIRNQKQLSEMEIIKNMVNECIRELFENFEIDIEDTYVERKTSLSSKLHIFFEDNQEKVEEKPKEIHNSTKKKQKMFVSPNKDRINSEKVIKNTEKISEKEEPSIKSDTKNLEENMVHDISFSINQSHEAKNGVNKDQMTVFINGMEMNTDVVNKVNMPRNEEDEKKTQTNVKNLEMEKKNERKKHEEKLRNHEEKKEKNIELIEKKQEKLERTHEKIGSHDKKHMESLRNVKPLKHEKNEKINKIEKKGSFDPVEKRSLAESEKKNKSQKMKEKAFKSYIAPHSGTSKTIQELINNSSCKKNSQNLNESHPFSSQIIKKSEEMRKNSSHSNSEQIIDKNNKSENVVLIQKEIKEKNEEKKNKNTQEPQISHVRNKSEDILLKKKEENYNNNELVGKKKEEVGGFENKREDKYGSKNEYSSERNRELTPNKRNPMNQNKFLNYYYFFEEKKENK